MMLIVLGGLSAGHVRAHEKYLLEGERWLVAEPFVSDDLASEFYAMRAIAKAQAPSEALARGVLSWEDSEQISPREAIALARETLNETPFGNEPGAFVVHGPPNEPTRLHVHFPFTLVTREKTHRRAEARRALWDAAVKVAARHGLTVPHRTGERYHLRIARAAQVWQTTPTLYSWIAEHVAPKIESTIAQATSWNEIALALQAFGIRYVATPRGGGGLCDDSRNVVVRASAISLSLSRTKLEQRLGPLPAFAPIDHAAKLRTSYAHAASTADEVDIERHRAARAAWTDLYEPRITTERSQLDDAYGFRCRMIAQTEKVLTQTIREVSLQSDERRALLTAAREYRQNAVDEALDAHTAAMRELYRRYPKKPSRKLREWQKDRITKHAPAGRIVAFEPRLPQLPGAPWTAVASPLGGLDLYYERRRVATDDGEMIGILDTDLPTEALSRLPLPQGFRVEGPPALRERMRDIAQRNGHTMSDGGDPELQPAPLHARLPAEPIARRCLALMDALRIRPLIDGTPYRAGAQVPVAARAIELRDPQVLVVRGPDAAVFGGRVQPTVVGESFAVYRCADAGTAQTLRHNALKAGLRIAESVPVSVRLRFTDAPIAKIDAQQTTLDPSLLAPLPKTPEQTRTRTRSIVPERKKKRRR